MKLFVLLFCLLISIHSSSAQTRDSIPLQRIEEVEVTSSRKPSVSLSTNPLQVVSSSDINGLGIQSISDAIRRFTGTVVKDYGGIGGFKTVAIRGNGAEHTGVFYDGVPITNAQSGQIDIGQFSLDNVDLLSLTIGQSDNIFKTARAVSSVGVLDIMTKNPVFSKRNYQLQMQVKGGSWGFFNPYLYFAHKLSNRFSISAEGSWQRANGEYSFERRNVSIVTKGQRQNSDTDTKRAEINLFGEIGSKQFLTAKIYYFDSERGLPGAVIIQDSGFVLNKSKERLWDRTFFSQAKYINRINDKVNFQVLGKFSHSYTKYIEADSKYDPIGFEESRYNQNEYYLSGVALYRLSNNLSFSLAEDFSYGTMRANYGSFASPERYGSLSAFSAKYESEKLTVIGNLLGTFITENVRKGNVADDKKKLSPSLSISYRPFDVENIRFRASYKNTFRVPSFNDLYYIRLGNSTLSPEKAEQFNVGTTWNKQFSELINFFSFSADLFYNSVRDKIVIRPTTFQPSMSNLGKVKITGLSLASNVSFAIADNMQLLGSANYTYQKAIDMTNPDQKNYKGQIPYTPLHTGSASLSFENPWVNFSYSLVVADKSYSSTANTEWFELSGYSDHSISLNKVVSLNKCRLRVQGDITNLLNKTYYIIKDYPMPGRGFRISVAMNL